MQTPLRAAIAGTAFTLFSTAAAATTVNITFTNAVVGGDLYLTPLALSLHDRFDNFTANREATAAIEALAEDGATDPINNAIEDFNGRSRGRATTVGLGTTGVSGNFNGDGTPALIEPGEVVSASIDLTDTGLLGTDEIYFSYLSMILPSNDFFIGNPRSGEHEIFDAAGNFNDGGAGFISFDVTLARVFDAGTELNSDGSDGILEYAPFSVGGQTGPNQGPDENGEILRLTSGAGNAAGLDLTNLLGTRTGAGTVVEAVPTGRHDLIGTFRIEIAPVPLPAAAPLLLVGLGGMAMVGRRRKKQQA